MSRSLVWRAMGSLVVVLAFMSFVSVADSRAAGSGGPSKESPAPTQGDVMRVLAEEKTLGEAAVSLLNQYAKDNQTVYVRGIVLYAEAKAKFDGLIEQLKADLADDRRPDQSPLFQQALQQASEKRQAFFDFVVHEVTPSTTGTKGIEQGLAAAVALIPVGTEAAVKIWREFRDGKAARREEIRRQLEAQKWLAFERLATAGG